jgi:hypothetical protein
MAVAGQFYFYFLTRQFLRARMVVLWHRGSAVVYLLIHVLCADHMLGGPWHVYEQATQIYLGKVIQAIKG